MRAKTEDGHEGLGFCYGGNTAGIPVADAARELLRPVLIGQDATGSRAFGSKCIRRSYCRVGWAP